MSDELRELDAEVAENVMGYKRWTCSDYRYKEACLFPPDSGPDSWNIAPHTMPMAKYGAVGVPCYSTDANHCREVEAEISAKGLQEQYAGHLCDLLELEYPLLPQDIYDVAHATPADRCRAALRTVEGQTETQRKDGE